MEHWLAENWLNIFTLLFGSGLWFAVFSIVKNTQVRNEEVKEQKIANLLAITASHREIWKIYLYCNNLERIRDVVADTTKHPITHRERVFVNLVIQQVNSVYYTMADQLVVEYDGIRRDIGEFFSLPIPNAVWRSAKPLQSHDFAAFVESALKNHK